jgi:hypothetical protein
MSTQPQRTGVPASTAVHNQPKVLIPTATLVSEQQAAPVLARSKMKMPRIQKQQFC